MSAATLLSVEALSKAYGGVEAVAGVEFELHEGEMLALIGPNGAGKTTCFDMLGGQVEPDRGRITIAGRNIAGLSPHRIFRLGVARTFQVAEVFRSMTVRENVETVLASAGGGKSATAILERTGMADLADSPAGIMAYGDVKRLELAMALASAPKIVLMDEPAAGMAAAERADLMALVARIAARDRIGILFTEHDMDAVFANAHRVLVMDHGRIIASGTPSEIREDANVRAVYLGDGDGRARSTGRTAP